MICQYALSLSLDLTRHWDRPLHVTIHWKSYLRLHISVVYYKQQCIPITFRIIWFLQKKNLHKIPSKWRLWLTTKYTTLIVLHALQLFENFKCLGSWYVQTCLYIFVKRKYGFQTNGMRDCPINKSDWDVASHELQCVSPNSYHCMLDEQGEPVKQCLGKIWIQEG